MATIKSYTDIEQSRKLAEILPIESADMMWKKELKYRIYSDEYKVSESHFIYYPIFKEEKIIMSNFDIPCWSLAALFNILPKNLNICRPSLDSNYKGYYWIQYYDEFMQPNDYKTECFNNPIDACYKMIIELHKLGLL